VEDHTTTVYERKYGTFTSGPHLNLPMPWTLQQAVEQAIKAHLKRKGKGPS
jgi:hypothetical protein